MGFKTDPDEKGTESGPWKRSMPFALVCFKTDPDEKGTERNVLGKHARILSIVSRLIPMKRELKDQDLAEEAVAPVDAFQD